MEDWVAIMELAHRWGFHEVMKLATREIERLEMPDIDRIVAYHKFELDRSLLLHRYAALTAREEPLNLEEGMALGMDTTLKIFRAREVARATPAADGSRSPTSATLPDDEMQSLIVDLFEIPEYSEPLPDDEPPRPQPTKKSPVKAAPVKKKQETPSAVPIAPEEPPAPPAPPAKSNRTSNATTNATPTTATATTKSTNGSAWGATGSTANKPASPWGSNATTNSKSNNASSSAAATTTSTPLADVPLASTDVSPSLSTTVDESGKDAKAINKNGDKSGDKDVKKASPGGLVNSVTPLVPDFANPSSPSQQVRPTLQVDSVVSRTRSILCSTSSLPMQLTTTHLGPLPAMELQKPRPLPPTSRTQNCLEALPLLAETKTGKSPQNDDRSVTDSGLDTDGGSNSGSMKTVEELSDDDETRVDSGEHDNFHDDDFVTSEKDEKHESRKGDDVVNDDNKRQAETVTVNDEEEVASIAIDGEAMASFTATTWGSHNPGDIIVEDAKTALVAAHGDAAGANISLGAIAGSSEIVTTAQDVDSEDKPLSKLVPSDTLYPGAADDTDQTAPEFPTTTTSEALEPSIEVPANTAAAHNDLKEESPAANTTNTLIQMSEGKGKGIIYSTANEATPEPGAAEPTPSLLPEDNTQSVSDHSESIQAQTLEQTENKATVKPEDKTQVLSNSPVRTKTPLTEIPDKGMSTVPAPQVDSESLVQVEAPLPEKSEDTNASILPAGDVSNSLTQDNAISSTNPRDTNSLTVDSGDQVTSDHLSTEPVPEISSQQHKETEAIEPTSTGDNDDSVRTKAATPNQDDKVATGEGNTEPSSSIVPEADPSVEGTPVKGDDSKPLGILPRDMAEAGTQEPLTTTQQETLSVLSPLKDETQAASNGNGVQPETPNDSKVLAGTDHVPSSDSPEVTNTPLENTMSTQVVVNVDGSTPNTQPLEADTPNKGEDALPSNGNPTSNNPVTIGDDSPSGGNHDERKSLDRKGEESNLGAAPPVPDKDANVEPAQSLSPSTLDTPPPVPEKDANVEPAQSLSPSTTQAPPDVSASPLPGEEMKTVVPESSKKSKTEGPLQFPDGDTYTKNEEEVIPGISTTKNDSDTSNPAKLSIEALLPVLTPDSATNTVVPTVTKPGSTPEVSSLNPPDPGISHTEPDFFQSLSFNFGGGGDTDNTFQFGQGALEHTTTDHDSTWSKDYSHIWDAAQSLDATGAAARNAVNNLDLSALSDDDEFFDLPEGPQGEGGFMAH